MDFNKVGMFALAYQVPRMRGAPITLRATQPTKEPNPPSTESVIEKEARMSCLPNVLKEIIEHCIGIVEVVVTH